MKKALVIEDEGNIRENLEDLLREEGFEVLAASDGAEGVALASQHRPAVILCDILLPKMDGYGVLGAIRANPATCSIPFLFLTAKSEKSDIRIGMNLGADDYVTKPFDNAELVAAVRARIDRAEHLALRRAAAAPSSAAEPPREARPPIVRDPAMRAVYEQIDLVAKDAISVLLLGETGVGKEVVARAIHARSPRAAKAFVALNCAALSETLLEAELFGHEKGAFTGATQDKKGLFETADGGTVFLDEVGELPAPIQVKLLRVLQEREVLRVGGRLPKRVDMRFLAATNRDLEQEILAGRFREDLYYRIAAFIITVPPLRERPLDIMPLAETFAASACRASGRSVPRFSAEAVELLTGYHWPGNVRELKNAVERALVLCGSGDIRPEHFALRGMRSRPVYEVVAPPSSRRSLHEEQTALERKRITQALEMFAGNQTRAADYLGISRRTLVSRLSDYELPRPRKR